MVNATVRRETEYSPVGARAPRCISRHNIARVVGIAPETLRLYSVFFPTVFPFGKREIARHPRLSPSGRPRAYDTGARRFVRISSLLLLFLLRRVAK